MFNDHGKWFLLKGTCYAYLERPRIGLAAGRLTIEAPLRSSGTRCGRFVRGHGIRLGRQIVRPPCRGGLADHLNDIRIDNVKDDSTRQALELLQSAAGTSLPSAVDIDLLQLLKPTVVPGTTIRVAVTHLNIRR